MKFTNRLLKVLTENLSQIKKDYFSTIDEVRLASTLLKKMRGSSELLEDLMVRYSTIQNELQVKYQRELTKACIGKSKDEIADIEREYTMRLRVELMENPEILEIDDKFKSIMDEEVELDLDKHLHTFLKKMIEDNYKKFNVEVEELDEILDIVGIE
jgi:hypothetical protein